MNDDDPARRSDPADHALRAHAPIEVVIVDDAGVDAPIEAVLLDAGAGEPRVGDPTVARLLARSCTPTAPSSGAPRGTVDRAIDRTTGRRAVLVLGSSRALALAALAHLHHDRLSGPPVVVLDSALARLRDLDFPPTPVLELPMELPRELLHAVPRGLGRAFVDPPSWQPARRSPRGSSPSYRPTTTDDAERLARAAAKRARRGGY